MSESVREAVRVAIFSLEKNMIVAEIETDIESTLHSDLFMAKVGSKLVPIWSVEDVMELNLDEVYEYVWFNK